MLAWQAAAKVGQGDFAMRLLALALLTTGSAFAETVWLSDDDWAPEEELPASEGSAAIRENWFRIKLLAGILVLLCLLIVWAWAYYGKAIHEQVQTQRRRHAALAGSGNGQDKSD